MEAERIAKRYAKSIFDLSKEKKVLEEIHKDFQSLNKILQNSKEFRLLLSSPIINSLKKLEMIKKVFQNQLNAITMTFMEIVFKRHRESVFSFVIIEFLKLYNIEKNITAVKLISASALPEQFKSDIQQKVEIVLKTTVALTEEIKPDLIGGFILRFGGKEYDGSISSILKKLRRQFDDTTFVEKI